MSKGEGWLSGTLLVQGWLGPRLDAPSGRKRKKGKQGRSRSHVALSLTLIAGVSAFGAGQVYAALSSTTANPGNSMQAGTVALTDNDGGSAMLSLNSAPLGASDTSCIKTSYSGSLPSNVRHYASATGALSPYLNLKVTRGTGANTFDNCSDFTGDTSNYFGKGAGVIYDGKLSNYPSSWATGIVDPGAGNQYSSMVGATPGLVGYWRLGDNAISADEFSDSTGTLLSNHTGGVGASWTSMSGEARTAVITDENRLRKETGDGGALYYTSGASPSADYLVEADVHVKSLLTSDSIGIVGRLDVAGNSYYMARYDVTNARWAVDIVQNGTILGSTFYSQSLTVGQTYRLSLEMTGTNLRLYVDGVQRVTATDSSLGSAGRGGVRLGTGASTAQPTATTGLHLDNFRITTLTTTAIDSKGLSNGTYVGGVRLNEPGATAGDSDRAVSFNGTSGRVEVPSQAALQLTGNFSIEAWIKPDAVVGTRWILQKGTLYYMYMIGSDVVFGYWSGGIYRYLVAPGVVSAGSWQHLAGTYDGSELRLYKNGAQVASTPQVGAIATNGSNLSIGNLSATGTGSFTGTIDEVALYNAKLSPADISAHYGGGLGEVWTNPESHAYKFQITLENDAAGLDKSATATFKWEGRNS
jgi:hypothetical protein